MSPQRIRLTRTHLAQLSTGRGVQTSLDAAAYESTDSGWDDWRRPASLAECWPLVLLGAAPLLGLAFVVFVATRAST